MAESNTFSSLMALAENHLTKKNSEIGGLTMGAAAVPVKGVLSDLTCNNTKLLLPKLNTAESSITSLLAEQVSNMLKARELKNKQEEDKTLVNETARLKLTEDPDDIDLIKALQAPLGQPSIIQYDDDDISSSDSLESLFEPKFTDDNLEPDIESPELLLPCQTDMSYILNIKVCSGKPSVFGKVLTSRIKPVAAPYLLENIRNPKISQFMFTTPSPCDLIKAKQSMPFCYAAEK